MRRRSASAAVASVTVKRLCPGKDLMSLTGWQLIAGSVVLLGLSVVVEPKGTIAAKAAHTQCHNHYREVELTRPASREEVLDAHA